MTPNKDESREVWLSALFMSVCGALLYVWFTPSGQFSVFERYLVGVPVITIVNLVISAFCINVPKASKDEQVLTAFWCILWLTAVCVVAANFSIQPRF